MPKLSTASPWTGFGTNRGIAQSADEASAPFPGESALGPGAALAAVAFAATRLPTVIAVVAPPVSVFLALNETGYGLAWICMMVGVHVNVPTVLVVSTWNWAPFGSPDAVSDVMACPSGSEAVTENVISVPAVPVTAAGAVTTGAWSTVGVNSKAPRSA